MNTRERFLSVLSFETPDDRLPMIEWAHWWDKTHHRWQKEGLPTHLSGEDLFDYFGLDRLECIFIQGISNTCPKPTYHGAPIIKDEASYEAIKHHLFTESLIKKAVNNAKLLKRRHLCGEIAVRLWLDGFFWFPRSLFGIEDHLYAFYDYPELMHRINNDLATFNLRAMDALFEILIPDMVGIAEDMSYNHGPMLSADMFDEFVAPYYAKLMPLFKNLGVKVLVDTDGDVTEMIPWLIKSGVDGIYPLERQAGVDIAEIRKNYPKLIMMGAYDKMVMLKGEAAIRAEFERLYPVMETGGFIPSVDHQTPPEVSLENYLTYRRLYEEYCIKTCVIGRADQR